MSIDDAGELYVISAPSGAGKTSLVRALLESRDDFGVAVSHTTRQMRAGEVDGINYHFVTASNFKGMIDAGEFLEWANVFEHLYGTSKQAASDVLQQGQHLILEIDWQGAQQVRKAFTNAISIFVFPPSLKALRDRLELRAQDDTATVDKRMGSAFAELVHWSEFDYLIVNDVFEDALIDLKDIVTGQGERLRREVRNAELDDLIKDLLP